ncbi:hypothetical protein EC968_008913 [Mortierella alpina]|nr:hypothetical protein EC968_008913 [Mortierella alpina]
MRTLTDYEMAMRTAWKLKTVSQMVPDKFYDFIGEVCYLAGSESNRTTMMMTDYTENEMLPYLESKGVRPQGKATILVTLWDEHFETFLKLKIKAGDVLYLKNLRCKVDLSNVFQLSMNGFKGRGFEQIDPIQILLPDDPRGKEVRARKAEYEMRQLDTEGVALSGVYWPQIATKSGYASSTTSTLNASNAGSNIKFSANAAIPGTITVPHIARVTETSAPSTKQQPEAISTSFLENAVNPMEPTVTTPSEPSSVAVAIGPAAMAAVSGSTAAPKPRAIGAADAASTTTAAPVAAIQPESVPPDAKVVRLPPAEIKPWPSTYKPLPLKEAKEFFKAHAMEALRFNPASRRKAEWARKARWSKSYVPPPPPATSPRIRGTRLTLMPHPFRPRPPLSPDPKVAPPEEPDIEEAAIPPTRVLKEQLKNEISKRTRDAACNNRTSPQLSNHYCIANVSIQGFRPPMILNFLKATCQNCAYRYELHATKKMEPKCPRCKKGQIKYSYDFDLDLKDDLGQTYEVHVGDDGARALLGSDFDPRLLTPEGNRLLRVKNKLAKIGIVETGEKSLGSTASLETKSPIWFDCCLRLSSTDLVVPKAEPVTESQERECDSQEDPLQPKSQPESQMIMLPELPLLSPTDVRSDSHSESPRAGLPGTQHESLQLEASSPEIFSQPFSQPSSPVLSSQVLSQSDSPVLVMQPYSQKPCSPSLSTQPLSQPGSPPQSLPLLEDMMRSQALETTVSKKRQPDRTLAVAPKKPRLNLAFFEEEPQTQVHRSLVFTAIN